MPRRIAALPWAGAALLEQHCGFVSAQHDSCMTDDCNQQMFASQLSTVLGLQMFTLTTPKFAEARKQVRELGA